MSLQLLVALVFIVATGAVLGVYALVANRSREALKRSVDERLGELIGHTVPVEESLIRAHATGPLPMVDRVASQALKGLALDRWIEQSGLKVSVGGLLIFSVAFGALAALVGVQLTHRAFVPPLAFCIGAALPFGYIRQKRAARLGKFEEHFPEALDLISRAIRAGHAFSAGLKMVADEMGEPIGPEFRKAFEEQNFGMSLKDALNHLCDRVPILDVRFFATAVLIQKETGGNLSEILDSLAAVVRERFKIRRQVRVHTAHGRFTGYVLLGLPAFLAVSLSFINPEHMDLLFKDQIGQMLIAGAIVMQAVGWLWIKKVIKIEV
jgi:tight adherence protein B